MIKTIALVAHDSRKKDLIEWVLLNRKVLVVQKLVCTGTTGKLIMEALEKEKQEGEPDADITLLRSGPLGGDQQLGSMIAERKIDMLIFLWDPMQAQPHDVDVKALWRITSLYNVPTAINRSSADFIISSPLFNTDYQPKMRDFSNYLNRQV